MARRVAAVRSGHHYSIAEALMHRSFAGCRFVWSLLILVGFAPSVQAQFNVPLPVPPAADVVFRDDMQFLFVDWLPRETQRRAADVWRLRLDTTRAWASRAKESGPDSVRYWDLVERFCTSERGISKADCVPALAPDAILRRIGSTSDDARKPGEVFVRWYRAGGKVSLPVPFANARRSVVSRYLRNSGGEDAFSVLAKFAANVSEDEAYVLTSLVRGLIGRTIFSADQAIVVTRSDDADPAKRDTIENDKANVLRAINNGGTLVARFTGPLYAATSSDASRAMGLSLSTGVIGPITKSDAGTRRRGVGSAAVEGLVSFPIRGLAGTAEVVGDLIVGARVGYTISEGPLLQSGGFHDVGFAQAVVGLRQNGALSVSALVTVANHGMNKLVPTLGLNLAAQR